MCASRWRAPPGSQLLAAPSTARVRSGKTVGVPGRPRFELRALKGGLHGRVMHGRVKQQVRPGKTKLQSLTCRQVQYPHPQRCSYPPQGWQSPSSGARPMHGCFKRLPVARRAWPNPSFKRSTNGRPPGPVWRYAVHFRQSGPGVLPSAPA